MEVLAWFGLAVGAPVCGLLLMAILSTGRRVALLGAAGFYVILWTLLMVSDYHDLSGLLRNAAAMVAVGALAYLFMFRDPTGQVTRSRCFVEAACENLGGTPDHEHYRDGGFPTVVRGRVGNVPVEVRISYASPGRTFLRSYAIHVGSDSDPAYAAFTRKAPTPEQLRSQLERLAAPDLRRR